MSFFLIVPPYLFRPQLAFGGMVEKNHMVMPGLATATGTGLAGGGQNSKLKDVSRVRNIFPETWLWTNVTSGYPVLPV